MGGTSNATRIENPFARWGVSQGWKTLTHRAVDYKTPWGTEFTAPASGIYEHLGGSLGYSINPTNPGLFGQVRLTNAFGVPDGRRIIVCHLSRHIAPHRARVVVGETVLGATGNSGHVKPKPTAGQPFNGSHMHTYGLDALGRRWDWTLDAVPAGGSATGSARPEGAPSGGASTKPKEWDEMATKEEIAAVVAAEVAKLSTRPSQSVRTVHARVEGTANEWTLGDPLVGQDLDRFDGVVTATNRRDLGGGVFEFRGFLVTVDEFTGVTWARIYAKGNLGEHSRTDRAGYIAIQKSLSLVATLEAHD